MPASDANVWKARPVLAGLLRAVVLGVPLLASLLAVLAVVQVQDTGAARSWPGLAVLLLVALGVSVVVERLVRRFLPVAVLLRLTMVFPDRAPSRLRMVRTVARQPPPRQLHWTGGSAGPVDTAEQVLHLVGAITAHDRRTRGHSERVRVYTELLAEELDLEPAARERLRWVALLHDVGKLGIAPTVLNKPGPLDDRELDVVREHPVLGAAHATPLLPWLGAWGAGIADHHERYDGSGYPAGKAGEEISEAGRLLAVVDAFETMTSVRPYKKAVSTRAARAELARCAGSHFDPGYVRAFLAISLPRVLWAMGPLAFAVQLPFLRSLAEAGARVGGVSPQTVVATGAAGAAAVITAGAAVTGTAVAAGGSSPVAPIEAAAAPSATGSGAAPDDGSYRLPGQRSTGGGRSPAAAAPAPPAAPPAPAPPPAPGPPPAVAAPPPAAAAAPVRPGGRTSSSGARPLPQPVRAAPAPAPLRGDGVTILSGPPATTTSTTAVFLLRAEDGRPLQCMSTRGGVVDGSAQQAGVRPCSELVSFRDLPPGTYTFRVRPVGESSWLEWSWEVVSP